MDLAFEEAKIASKSGEVPVGAVIIKNMKVIAKAHNLTETLKDPTAHAEMIAIKRACDVLNSKYLTGCDMYVTLEPCAMCAGALVNSRIRGLYIGAMDIKMGACGGKIDIVTETHFNHKVNVFYGIEEEKCSKILSDFFEKLR